MRQQQCIGAAEQQNSVEPELLQTILAQVCAVMDAMTRKDPYTCGHSQRVAGYARMLAAQLGQEQQTQERVYRMALLHDVGKLKVSVALLHKSGVLTGAEACEMRSHAVLGEGLLLSDPILRSYAPAARWHHEWYNGAGYPDGLRGSDIPPEVRIITVADAYDAMTSARTYQQVLPQVIVRQEIERGNATQFDPDVVAAMLKLISRDTHYRMHSEA